MQDTRTSKEFSITIRTNETDGVRKYEKPFLNWLDTHCTHYVVAYEQKGDLSTEHFQVAAVFVEDKRSDHLKATLVGICEEVQTWTPEQKKYAICVKKNRKNNDIRLLAGGYCCKQDTTPFIKGWTLEDLEPYQEQYDELKEKALLRNISRENIVSYLKDWNDKFEYNPNTVVMEKYSRLSHRQRLDYIYQYGITQGADLQKYSTPVWINYFVNNFRVLFCSRTAEDLMEILENA